MVSNGFICAHKLLGYFLLPVRIMLIIPFLIFALITIWLYNFGILPKDAGNFALKVFAMMLTTVFGLNVHIKKDKAYEKYKKMSKDDKFLVLEIDQMGMLSSKKFYDKESMNDIEIAVSSTDPVYGKRSFVYDFLSSMRQKINDPLGKRAKQD